jgi:hypothetical protein
VKTDPPASNPPAKDPPCGGELLRRLIGLAEEWERVGRMYDEGRDGRALIYRHCAADLRSALRDVPS